MDDWSELDDLVNELRQQHEERWQRLDDLRQQFSALQPHVDVIGRQVSDLAVDDHLHAVNQRLLGGLGSVETVRSGAGVEYIAALLWPAHIAPTAAPDAPGDGVYRIEVWLGLGLEDGRPRIRISGSKRLEAVLPTTSARFRAALLAVLKSPQFVATTGDAPAEAAAEPAQHPEPDAPESQGQNEQDGDESGVTA
jgi:hypothetical protein